MPHNSKIGKYEQGNMCLIFLDFSKVWWHFVLFNWATLGWNHFWRTEICYDQYLQAFFNFRASDFCNFWFNAFCNSILLPSPLVLLSILTHPVFPSAVSLCVPTLTEMPVNKIKHFFFRKYFKPLCIKHILKWTKFFELIHPSFYQ
mgnify:CR=1 FL=1